MSPVPELLHPGARRRRSALLPKTSGVARSLGILLFAVSLVSSGLGFRLPRPETKASPPKSPSEEPSRAPRTFLRSSESVPRRCFLSVGEAMVLRGAWAGTQRALDLAKTIGVRAFSTQTGRRRPELQSFFFNEMEKPRVVFVLGGPGAGKGTQCSRIQKYFNIPHLSAGDCLREEQAKPDSPYAQLIDKSIREGQIVPVRITLRLLLKKMLASGFSGIFLIDGFPRNDDNLSGWLEVTRISELPKELEEIASHHPHDPELQAQCREAVAKIKKESSSVDKSLDDDEASSDHSASHSYAEARQAISIAKCFFFECSNEVLQHRVQQRGHNSGNQRRADDNAGALAKRLKTHAEQTLPLLDFFRKLNLLETIQAENSIEEVWEHVKTAVENIQAKAPN